ncbi:MAG: hypothetical protein R2756_08760 [Bacteroidales bacterium]
MMSSWAGLTLDADPCGYRTVFTAHLAEDYYGSQLADSSSSEQGIHSS